MKTLSLFLAIFLFVGIALFTIFFLEIITFISVGIFVGFLIYLSIDAIYCIILEKFEANGLSILKLINKENYER